MVSRRDESPAKADRYAAEEVLPLDPTGVPNLDLVLGGGLVRGTLAIFVGPPGCGKTTLAMQLAFAAAQQGRRVLILTALSEPTSKLLSHLRGYEFFDPKLLGNGVQVLSLQRFLPTGLASTASEVIALARDVGASMVVLDGLSGIRPTGVDPQAGCLFLFDVGTTLSLQGATTIITAEALIRDPQLFPEATTSDTILGLHFSVQDERQMRRIEVMKARGVAPLPGLHGFAITSAGVVVSPRLEARVQHEAAIYARTVNPDLAYTQPIAGIETERATFDLPALDVLVGGGLTRTTATMVIGSGGTGKTLLGLHFALAGIAAGEPVVFLGFHENQRQLLLKADAFNLGQALRGALAPGGGLTLIHMPPVELEADALADRLLNTLDRTGARRLVVDSIAILERAVAEGSTPRRVQNFLAALIAGLQLRRVTTLFTRETGPFAGTDLELESDLSSGVAENVIWLQGVIYRERFYRVLSVLKMRYSTHDLTLREFTITAPAGIEVRAPSESERDVMEGIAHQEGDPLWNTSSMRIRARQHRPRVRRPHNAEQRGTE
jgi:circadian clock protein KaiC